MATPTLTARQILAANRKKRTEQLIEMMTPIDKNGDGGETIKNCGHVALKLNSYLGILDNFAAKMAENKEKGESYSISPVPTTDAGQFFSFTYPSKRRIDTMETNNTEFLTRCTLRDLKIEELIGQGTLRIDLTVESENNAPLALHHATTETIVEKLRALPRASLNKTAFGFLIFASIAKKAKDGKKEASFELHVSNFLVDTDGQVYFLDAQDKPIYIKETPPPGYIKDIFYASSVPAPVLAHATSPVRSPVQANGTDDIKIKKEGVETEHVSPTASASSSSSSTTSASPSSSSASNESDPAVIFEHALQYLADRQARSFNKNNIDIMKGMEYLQKAVMHKHAPAQFVLGICYQVGVGVAKDIKMAFEYYKLAAEQDFARAQFHLGICYRKGMGISENAKKAFEYFESAAEKNDAGAQYELAWYYREGGRVAKDLIKSFGYAESAAKQEHAEAQNYLGHCYEMGFLGVARDTQKALHYYRLAANQGNVQAKISLLSLERHLREEAQTTGSITASNLGNPQASSSLPYLSEATEVLPGFYSVVKMKWLRNSTLVVPLPTTASVASSSASRSPSVLPTQQPALPSAALVPAITQNKYSQVAEALYKEAMKYLHEANTRDIKKGMALLQSAARDFQWAPAQFQLGDYYKFGIFFARDDVKAFKNYQFAASQNHSAALVALGNCYLHGMPSIDLAQDYTKSFAYYQLAAERNHMFAQAHVADCYEAGRGVARDINKAIECYTILSSKGYETAKDNLQRLQSILKLARSHFSGETDNTVLYMKAKSIPAHQITQSVGATGIYFTPQPLPIQQPAPPLPPLAPAIAQHKRSHASLIESANAVAIAATDHQKNEREDGANKVRRL